MITLGLQRITHLLQPLFTSHPNGLPWKAIHIAGTNGYRVGRFTSPHLIDRWDSITLNQRVVERERFLEVENRVKRRSQGPDGAASEFEILTATAFELFTDEGVDIAVVECGLGGRLDATNVLRREDVLVSVLAKVGLDHVDFLGSTIEQIAREKVGIFKGVPVVVDQSNEASVLDVVREKIRELGGWGMLFHLRSEEVKDLLEIEGVKELRLAKHQYQNLVTAYTAYLAAEEELLLREIVEEGADEWEARIAKVAQNLPELVIAAKASLRGRLEWLVLPAELVPSGMTRTVPVLLDGAHNVQSAQALASYVDSHLRQDQKPVTWVLAMKNDKDIRSILFDLLNPFDRVVTCEFGPVDGMPWVKSMDSARLAEIVREVIRDRVEVAEGGSVGTALRRAVEIAGQEGSICVAGSLYLVGDVLRLVRDGLKIHGSLSLREK
ncbi:folylpolyglutamate synthase [Elasticomyces elasticus]|uniref:Folylpolyglutamate synthase n=1 Tax=Exophiala sideris TaxID=1016849 RepID=A0ABR0IXI6_9EURO|nr:folylpolyglutamate synthase [Elasticomyces elasticus]KAK5021957.1 folylpolyglutamate synthase [Exophiala sideris]KAK5026020.1 folylpolyglutamate synthase [Exophiala sideris]KAK5050707.1 folylpolyglutamate synthase [Exophiala sideris]KAK5177192.1 folylpolyglutamate synthase [Eurotiomycetes sp. CCFEE 6388]